MENNYFIKILNVIFPFYYHHAPFDVLAVY